MVHSSTPIKQKNSGTLSATNSFHAALHFDLEDTMTNPNLNQCNGSIILDEHGSYHGIVDCSASASFDDLNQNCVVTIGRHLSVLELASMCAAIPSATEAAVHCFRCFHGAHLEINDLYALDQAKYLSTVMLLQYFGSSARSISIKNADSAHGLNGLLVLKMLAKYCRANLKTVKLDGLRIDLAKCDYRARLSILTVLINVNEWIILNSVLGNCGLLFEFCADSIEKLVVHDTSMDTATAKVFAVQSYPHLKELSLNNSKGTKSKHMCPKAFGKLLKANADVCDLLVSNKEINKKTCVNFFQDHRAEFLHLVVPWNSPQFTLGHMPNIRALTITLNINWLFDWWHSPLAKDLEVRVIPTLIVHTNATTYSWFILKFIFGCPHVQKLLLEFKNLYQDLKNLISDHNGEYVRIDLDACRGIFPNKIEVNAYSNYHNYIVVAFAKSNMGKTFDVVNTVPGGVL